MSTTIQTQTIAPHAAEERAAGVLLNRYRVLETNNQGGFGSVHICWDTRLERRVAIKCMPLAVADDSPERASTIGEALAEARTISGLDDDHIVTLYDFECDGTMSYLVMEYVNGINLAELLARVEGGVLTFDECAKVVASVARALSYAHAHGVLHLDIKPANILINRAGDVKLGDFGMASLASAAGFGGARGGTVGYMPPEQIEGELVDERTDVFALAVVAWQALTGTCPFAADTPEESRRLIEHGPSPTISRIEPELAGLVEETLLRALSPDPRARMSSVDAFARDLVRNLGDVREGGASLADLLQQTDENAEPSPVEARRHLRLPLAVRLPWLRGALVRTLSAALAAWCTWQVIPHVLPGSATAAVFGSAGAVVACASWPPLTGVFGIIMLALGLLSTPTHLSLALALPLLGCGIVWWSAWGRRYQLSGPALLLGTCLGYPSAGVGLAGIALSPFAALVTGGAGYVLSVFFACALSLGFDAAAIGETLRATIDGTAFWVGVASASAAAWLCSLVSERRTTAACIVGQVLAVCVLALPALMSAHMENTDFSTALAESSVALAVILSTTLCIAHALVGEEIPYQEGD